MVAGLPGVILSAGTGATSGTTTAKSTASGATAATTNSSITSKIAQTVNLVLNKQIKNYFYFVKKCKNVTWAKILFSFLGRKFSKKGNKGSRVVNSEK